MKKFLTSQVSTLAILASMAVGIGAGCLVTGTLRYTMNNPAGQIGVLTPVQMLRIGLDTTLVGFVLTAVAAQASIWRE